MGRMISEPTPLAQSMGARPMTTVPSVRSLGRSRCTAPFEDGLAQLREAHSLETARPRQGLAQVDEHDDPGRGRHAEAGDVADPDRDRELLPEEPLEEEPAGDRARDGQKHRARRRPGRDRSSRGSGRSGR